MASRILTAVEKSSGGKYFHNQKKTTYNKENVFIWKSINVNSEIINFAAGCVI